MPTEECSCRSKPSPGPVPSVSYHGSAEAQLDRESGHVLTFPPLAAQRNRLSMRDRMQLLRWAECSERHGFTRIVFDTASERSGHEPGDYVLIYERDALWASWGIGCADSALTLWNASTGVTIGSYATMTEALAAAVRAASGR